MQARGWASTLAGVLVLALALAAAGCGGESGDDGSGVPRAADGGDAGRAAADTRKPKDAEEAMLAFARCMRANGVDMPDPQEGEGAFVITPDTDASERNAKDFREASDNCRRHLEGLEPPELSDEQREALEEATLKHVRCMREHGIDMPDPTFGEGGRMAVPLDGIDLDDPDFRAAQEACEKHLRDAFRGRGSGS